MCLTSLAVHSSITHGASFSFNYNTLLVVASVIAGLGLVSNSSTTVIASMLVSPIMGPVIGLAYGSTIRDWKLVRRSFKVEFISLIVCVCIGFAVCASTGWTELSEDWPTKEMTSRGEFRNFLVALPVAFFSGLGVAVSLLDNQTASLVGVAISASLLPPAVDSGILWIAHFYQEADILFEPVPKPAPAAYGSGIEPPTKKDYREMAIVSLWVTLANIALIWISGMLMFRIKEVLPIEKNVSRAFTRLMSLFAIKLKALYASELNVCSLLLHIHRYFGRTSGLLAKSTNVVPSWSTRMNN